MASASGAPKSVPEQFTAGTEEEVEYLLYHMYGPQHSEKHISVSAALQYLAEFKISNDRAKMDIVACVAKHLCTQYLQYNNYPYDKLIVTAQLLGGMIGKELYSTHLLLGLMLRCVLQSLKEQPQTKLFVFGLVAFNCFRGNLYKYRLYARNMRNTCNLEVFPEHLKTYVNLACNSKKPTEELDGPVLPADIVILPSVVKAPSQFISRYFP